MRCCQACTRHAQASAGDLEQTGAHHAGIFPTQRGSIALFPLEIRRSPLNCGWARRLCSLAGMRGSEGRPIPLLPSEDRGGHRRLAPGPAGWQPRRKRRRRFLLPRTSNCDPPRPAHLCPSRERVQSPSSLPGARMSSTLAWMKNLDTLWRGAANVGKSVWRRIKIIQTTLGQRAHTISALSSPNFSDACNGNKEPPFRTDTSTSLCTAETSSRREVLCCGPPAGERPVPFPILQLECQFANLIQTDIHGGVSNSPWCSRPPTMDPR